MLPCRLLATTWPLHSGWPQLSLAACGLQIALQTLQAGLNEGDMDITSRSVVNDRRLRTQGAFHGCNGLEAPATSDTRMRQAQHAIGCSRDTS